MSITSDLIDAQAMALENPETFDAPGTDLLMALKVGLFVKVCRNGERFWVRLTEVGWQTLVGTVANILGDRNPDLPYGAEVRLERRHVYDVDL